MITKKENFIGVIGYLEGECEECQIKLSSLRAEINKVEDSLVGYKERLIRAREALRRYADGLPKREATLREVEIARMVGVSLEVGEPISNETWAWVCSKRSS